MSHECQGKYFQYNLQWLFGLICHLEVIYTFSWIQILMRGMLYKIMYICETSTLKTQLLIKKIFSSVANQCSSLCMAIMWKIRFIVSPQYSANLTSHIIVGWLHKINISEFWHMPFTTYDMVLSPEIDQGPIEPTIFHHISNLIWF